MMLRNNDRARILNHVLVTEKMAPKMATVCQKSGFSRFLFFREIESGISRVSIGPTVPEDTHAKFRMDPLSRLGCRRGQTLFSSDNKGL